MATAHLTLVVEEGVDAVVRRRDDWRSLLAATPDPPFFLREEWLENFARHFAGAASGRRLLLALGVRGGTVVAGLPLTLGPGRVGRWRVKKLEIAGSPWLDQVDLPRRSDDDAEAFLAALLRFTTHELRGWTLLEAREFVKDGFAIEATARAASRLGLRFERSVCSRAPTLDVSRDGTRPRSANLRSQLSRSARRFAELGAVETRFELVEPASVDSLVAECSALESASWKGDAAVGIFATPDRAAFFRDVFRALAASGRLAIGTLRVDGALAACHLGFVHARRFLSYCLAHHPRHAAAGPGTLLMQRMVETASQLGVDVLDASRGGLDHDHLLVRYGGPIREHEQLLVWRPGVKSAAMRFARRHVVPHLRRLLPASGGRRGP